MANDQAPAEDDWWLPDYVTASPTGAFYPAVLPISWKQMNPAPGVYDFSVLDDALAAGEPFWIVPYLADAAYLPGWVIERHDLQIHRYPEFPRYATQFGEWSQGYFVEVWDDGYQQELGPFLRALAGHPAFHSDLLAFMYAPGAWRWGEWETVFIDQMVEAGLTPQAYLDALFDLIDLFASAFAGSEHRLVWTGYDNPEGGGGRLEWEQALGRKISEHALSRGFGARHGITESFNWGLTDLPNWGVTPQTLDGTPHPVVDESTPLVADHDRVFATENECFGDCDEGDTGRSVDRYYNEKMANLKALQLQMRWVDVREGGPEQYPDLYRYLRLSLGKTVEDSPDAWVALRSWKDDSFPMRWDGEHLYDVRNWERWLRQLEVAPEGLTAPAHPAIDHMIAPDADFDYPVHEARRTRHAQGSNYMYFDVDDRFAAPYTGSYQLKVTYFDDASTPWVLEYASSDVAAPESPVTVEVPRSASGRWRTVTVPLDGAALRNGIAGMDFRLFDGGTDDLTVRFVRLIKIDPIG